MSLRTDYVDDVLDTTQNTNRVFDIKDSNGNIIESNVSLEDVTEYLQEGDGYGASEINEQNEAINGLLNPEFTSSDNASIFNSGNLGGQSTYAWEATDKLNSGDSHTTLFAKISKVFKNLRTIAKLIGTTDISSLGGGTITGAISALDTDKFDRERDIIPIVNGGTGAPTVAAARNALGLGNTSGAVPIANGGTGATTAANARTGLGVPPTNHASTGTGYGKGTNTYFGHVALSSSTSSTSGTDAGVAATPAAVKAAYDAATNKVLFKVNAGDSPTGAWTDMKYPLCLRSFVVTCNSGSTKTTTFTKFPNAVLYAIAYCDQANFGATSTVDVTAYSNGSVTVHQINTASAGMQIRLALFGY